MKSLVIALMSITQTALAASLTTDAKYIIAFGGVPSSAGGVPTPQNMVDHAELIGNLPVDGLVINLTNVEGYFANKLFVQPAPSWEKIQPELDAYAKLNRGRGPANHDFLRVNTSELAADWYDDETWGMIVANFRFLGRAMAAMGVRAIMIDTEAYVGTPFNYMTQILRTDRDFAAYCAQARKRGREIMAAVTESVPAVIVMMTFGPCSASQEGERSNIVANSMGLVPAFTRGLQEGAPKGKVIDGYETAYTYRSYAQFQKGREWMTSPRTNSFPGYDGGEPVRPGFGIWLRRSDASEGQLDLEEFTNNSHTPEEWQHALHYALLLADSYIWVYSVPYAILPEAYRKTFADARKPHPLDFQPLAREAENRPAAYIISAQGRGDTPDAVVFAPLYRAHEELFDFPKTWKFRLDPDDAGEQEKWFAPGLALDDWQNLRIDDWWEPQLNRTYLGAAWYRIEFTPPKEWKGRKLLLCFGAVDEDAYVYLNGELLGTHAYGADGWNTPFEFALDGRLRFGEPNTLAVRVVSKAGVGGIWKSVKIFAARTEHHE
jgi:hypothetical protein